jgi:hypothetical protein
MVCETRVKRNQTLQQRLEEIRQVVALLSRRLAAGQAKAIVGPQGAIAFTGLTEAERADVTDNCAYRLLRVSGSPLALQAIARAEALAGLTVDQKTVAQGTHGHADAHGNITWHRGH